MKTSIRTFFFSITIIILVLFPNGCKRNLLKTEKANIERIKSEVKNYLTTNWEKRLKTVKELTKYENKNDNRILEFSLIAASRDNHPEVRIEALKGLAKLKTEEALPRIREMALSDPSDNVRWYAFKALSLYSDPGLINVFIQGFNDDDWLIKEASLVGILLIDDESVYRKKITYTVLALRGSIESIQKTALETCNIQSPEIFREIKKIFLELENRDYTMLKAVLKALDGYKIDDETKDRLVELLLHSNREIRLLSLSVLKTDLKKRKKEASSSSASPLIHKFCYSDQQYLSCTFLQSGSFSLHQYPYICTCQKYSLSPYDNNIWLSRTVWNRLLPRPYT